MGNTKDAKKNSWFRAWFNSGKSEDYAVVEIKEYLESFGLKENPDGRFEVVDTDKIKAAYDRACENRDFEIDKFWSRAAYFWGFIVLIFGAYFSVSNSDKMKPDISLFLNFCLICMGILFSLAWYFVIIGSKHWQENWESHIDALEDYVSGPLYKTIHFKNDFYSVSKINQILSIVIVFVWIGIFFNFLYSECNRFLGDGVPILLDIFEKRWRKPILCLQQHNNRCFRHTYANLARYTIVTG